MTKVDRIAERIRQEPFRILSLRTCCLTKSFKFRRLCLEAGIEARMVLCVGWVRAKHLGFWMKIPRIHAWGEVNGKRIEISAPLDTVRPLGYLDVDIKPVIAIWI